MSVRKHGKIIAGTTVNPDLFDFKWADHILDDISWVRADTFSWQPGIVYTRAYQHLFDDIYVQAYAWYDSDNDRTCYTTSETPEVGDDTYAKSGNSLINRNDDIVSISGDSITTNYGYTWQRKTESDFAVLSVSAQTETIAGITITYYRAEDGHKVVLPDQESNVLAIYAAIGVAWYYIVDVENTRFKLPRTKFGFTGMRDGVGKYVAPGAPNITGTLDWGDRRPLNLSESGAFYNNAASTKAYYSNDSSQNKAGNTYFSASRSSSIYGNSDTIQPPATQMYLYFYAGNYTPSAVAQTAGLNAELFNNKLDVNMSNVSASAATNMNGVGIRTVVETYASGVDWYRRYSDGWVEQGCDSHNRGSSNTWNFLIAMPGTYNAQITAHGSQRYAWVTNMGSTYLTFNAADDSSQNNDGLYYIKVCGYAAS